MIQLHTTARMYPLIATVGSAKLYFLYIRNDKTIGTSRLLACTSSSLRKYSTEVDVPTTAPSVSSPLPERVEILEPADGRYDPLSIFFRIKKKRKKQRFKEDDVKQLFPNAVSYDITKVPGLATLTNHGTIKFSSASTAKEVIQNMNGKVLKNGAVLKVGPALRPPEEWLTLDQIEIPKKIERSPTAILEALSATVGKDYSRSHYVFLDDPTCYPRSKNFKKSYLEFHEAGKEAAKLMMKNYPANFEFNETRPRLEGYNFVSDELELAETSETALLECIQKRKVIDAIAMHKECDASGIQVSADTNLRLLDLLTVYNCEIPFPTEAPKDKLLGERQNEGQNIKARWKTDGHAEKLFSFMLENNQVSPRAYNMMLKGRAKYSYSEGAVNLYKEMQKKNIPVEVEAYNLMMNAVLYHRQMGQIENVQSLLMDMKDAGVAPNITTFNAYLRILYEKKIMSKGSNIEDMLKALKEIKIVGLEPCLGTWYLVLRLGLQINKFTKKSKVFCLDFIRQVLDHMEGKMYTPTCQEDYFFFSKMITEIRMNPDIDATYRLHKVLHTGNHYRFLNSFNKETSYHYDYLDLIKLFEPFDVVVDALHELSPTVVRPVSGSFVHYLESKLIDDEAYKCLPKLWSGMIYGSATSNQLVDFYLKFMCSKKHLPELQEKFVEIAKDLLHDLLVEENFAKYFNVQISTDIINSCMMIYFNSDLTEEVWKLFEFYFKERATIGSLSLDIFLYKLMPSAIELADIEKAIMCLECLAHMRFEKLPEQKEKVLSSFQNTITPIQRKYIEKIKPTSRRAIAQSAYLTVEK